MNALRWAETAIVTVGGTGFSPIAPATVASAATCVIFWFVPSALLYPTALLIIPALFIGVWLSGRSIGYFDVMQDSHFKKLRRPNPKQEDPDQVVLDEFVGQWITLIAVPHSIVGFALGFVAFRIFDIFKPFGISATQRLSGGWGIMVDDVLAGLGAAIVMFCLFRFVPALASL